MKKVIKTIVFLLVIGTVGYYFRVPLHGYLARLENQVLPCSQPITYKIGTFDTRFGISKANFLSAIQEAEQIWEKPAGKQLFTLTPNGDLKINLLYDSRQQATTKLQQLGIAVDETRGTYDNLKARYDVMTVEYNTEKAQFETQLATFNSDQSVYNAEVNQFNKSRRESQADYDRLQTERDSLNARAAGLNQLQAKLNADVDTINALVITLNHLAGTLNIAVNQFNQVGASRGEEFNEALYRSDVSGPNIDVYQFDNRAKLIRVLAHELSHALGLNHVDDPRAIMYRLNQGTNEKLTTTDLAALNARCNLK